jgi:hypothetical protein
MAVTQIQAKQAPKQISVNGIDYRLRKDALSADPAFPYEKMNWLYAGCDMAAGVYCCWIVGIIPPAPGTLERPVSVFALGFSPRQMLMSPTSLSATDMQRMHYYVADTGNLVQKFVSKFLGMEPATDNEPAGISPYPEEVNGHDNKGARQESRSVAGADKP